MQMRAGLMPGGVAQMPPLISPPQMGPRPADMSRNLQVQFLQQQQQQRMAQMVTPPPMQGSMTPSRRPSPFEQGMMFPGMRLPGPQFGRGRMMARQQARSGTNEMMGQAQAGMGLGMRSIGTGSAALMGGAMGSVMGPSGTAMGAAAGAATFEHFGGGQRMQDFGASMMQPMIRNRQQALQLQNLSMSFVRGGSDMSQSGLGLSMAASTRLSSQLNTMAGSEQFKKETGGRFNKQDVMKITRLAGEMGMMEQSQTADQIKDSIGKISRSLSNFMKIAEEPDVQEAMKMMGQMRSMGMSVGQTSTAAANARQFARMAGTSTQGVMSQGMQGAQMFQQLGLSGASGLSAGMASQGMAGQMAGLLDPRRLAMAGGQGGIARTLMGGAARSATLDALLPGMLTRRNGRMVVDQQQIMRMATGEMNVQQAVQAGTERIGGRRGLMELATRRRELQDEAQQAMGGQMTALMPLIHARMIAQSMPGMTMGAALVATGMGEQDARTYQQMVQNPEFWNRMREQQRVTFREERNDLRDRRVANREEAEATRPVRRLQALGTDQTQRLRTAQQRIEGFFARREDAEEERASQGGGRVIGTVARSELATDTERAATRDLSRTQGGRRRLREGMTRAGRAVDRGRAERGGTDEMVASLRGQGPFGIGTLVAEAGEAGLEMYRGGESQREVVNRNQGMGTRVMRFMGAEVPTAERVEREGAAIRRQGRRFERVNTQTSEQRDTQLAGARRATGRAGASDEDQDRMLSIASAAINQHAEESITNLGPLGSIQGEFTEESQRAAVEEQLREAGFEPGQIQAALQSEDFLQTAITSGARARTASAQQAIDNAVDAGGESATQRRQQGDRISRERSEEMRETALEDVGLDAGFASSTSRDQQRAVLGALSGEGRTADTRRQVMAARALQARASEIGGDEGAALTRQANDIMFELQRGDDARTDEELSVAQSSLAGIDDTTLIRMGDNLEGRSTTEILAGFDEAGERITEAATGDVRRQLAQNLGEAGATALQEGGIEGLQALLESGGEIEGLEQEERDRLLTGIRGRRINEASLNRRAGREVTNAAETEAAGALSQLAEGNPLSAVYAVLQDFADVGEEAPVSDEVQPGEGGPMTFEQAVSTFSEASANLLAASENLQGSGVLGSLGRVANAGSPLQNVPFTPLGAVLSLFGGD